MYIAANNIVYQACTEVRNLAADLLKSTDISYVQYGRFYDDHCFSFTTHSDFLAYLDEADYLSPSEEVYHMLGTTLLAEDLLPSEFMTERNENIFKFCRQYLKLDYCLMICERHQHYIDLFVFGTSPGNHAIINFYLNHLTDLHQFCNMFLSNAHDLLQEATDNPDQHIICPQTQHIIQQCPSRMAAMRSHGLIHKLPFDQFEKKYFIQGKNGKVYLSKREIECIMHLCQGKGAKSIAKLFESSPKTVEKHLEHLRTKLHCCTKQDILTTYLSQVVILQG